MPTPRKDLSAHTLQGTTARYIDENSDVPASRPRYPKNLSPESKRFFKGICRMLEKRSTLTEGDQELIRLAAILRDRHERAVEKVAEEGEICTYVRLDSNGAPHDLVKENLWLRVAKDSEKQMVAILDRLGLTPAARGKIKQVDKPKDKPALPGQELLDRLPPVEDTIDLASIREDLIQ